MKATEGHTVGLVNGKTFVWQKKCVKNKRCRKWMITEVMVWRCSSCQSYFRFFILAENYNICWQQRVNWIKCTRKNWSYRWWSVSVSCVGAVWCIQWKPAFGGVKTSDDSLYWQQYCCTSWSSACIFSLFPHKALLVFCSVLVGNSADNLAIWTVQFVHLSVDQIGRRKEHWGGERVREHDDRHIEHIPVSLSLTL